MAPRYVEASYVLFERELDITWCFGSNDTDIMEMDHSLLADVRILQTKHIGKAYHLQGLISEALHADATHYIMIGEPGLLTTWILPWLLRLLRPKAKVMFWTHGWYGRESRLKAMLKRFYFKPAHAILTYGDYARRLMIEAGFNAERIFAIHNSLNHDLQVRIRQTLTPSDIYSHHFGNTAPVLLFIGRLTAVKHLDMLLKAVRLLADKEETYNIVFVGNGTERAALQQQTEQLQLADRVWFYGESYDEQTNATLIYNADLCVSPGNVGLTAMHALVYGTPVLTHDDFTWQMPEFEAVVDGTTGSFFHHGSTESLSQSIALWFEEHRTERDAVRQRCMDEIDSRWTPEYELSVLKKALNL